MRLFLIDTLATIFFFTVVATFSELVIAGMEPSQVFTTRLLMIPIMVVTARPYTGWRDCLLKQVRPQRRWSAALTDIAAFLSFQAPVYAATLLIAGASLSEIGAAIGSAILFMIILARPFGVFVDKVRGVFRVATS